MTDELLLAKVRELRTAAKTLMDDLDATEAPAALRAQAANILRASANWERYAQSDLATVRGAVVETARLLNERFYGASLVPGAHGGWKALERATWEVAHH